MHATVARCEASRHRLKPCAIPTPFTVFASVKQLSVYTRYVLPCTFALLRCTVSSVTLLHMFTSGFTRIQPSSLPPRGRARTRSMSVPRRACPPWGFSARAGHDYLSGSTDWQGALWSRAIAIAGYFVDGSAVRSCEPPHTGTGTSTSTSRSYCRAVRSCRAAKNIGGNQRVALRKDGAGPRR